MEELKFSTVLESVPVVLETKDGVKNYTLKELNGDQRAEYNKSFDVRFEMKDGKAQPIAGDNFKIISGKEFLAMCLYDEADKLVPIGVIGKLPGRVVEKLHKAGLELSGLSDDGAEAAKND